MLRPGAWEHFENPALCWSGFSFLPWPIAAAWGAIPLLVVAVARSIPSCVCSALGWFRCHLVTAGILELSLLESLALSSLPNHVLSPILDFCCLSFSGFLAEGVLQEAVLSHLYEFLDTSSSLKITEPDCELPAVVSRSLKPL